MSLSLWPELKPLAELLEKDEPKVLVVVGAGVSIDATSASHASWLGLLKHGVDYLIETKIITVERHGKLLAALKNAFSLFDLQKALALAELIEQELKILDDAAFANWLKAAFDESTFRAKETKTLDALREIQQAGALLLTTNYDSLLSGVTDLPRVTWEQHTEFLETMTRQRAGVLHIHGHWRQPSSVVLGKSSYNRIAQDQDLQDAFKSLWLNSSWLYVGCGDGLDDPNLGRLLEWGKRWGTAQLPHYFLAKDDKALVIGSRPGRPPKLVTYGYSDHSKLPGVLHSVTPTARCSPFTLVDADFPRFRSPGSSPVSIPFPSWQEYLDGEVPALAADGVVQLRLRQHGWAFVLDVVSVGKTTLAERTATAMEQRDHPAFYFNLATVVTEEDRAKVRAAMQRLSRPSYLLILDNVHHEPDLARQLWDHWWHHQRGSKLLLIATRMQRTVNTSAAQDLVFFEHHVKNPAIALSPTSSDLWAIVKYLYRRVGGLGAPPLAGPPRSALQAWHRDYGRTLGAFCLAVLDHLAQFRRGQWALPLGAASEWVRDKWLNPRHLDTENRDNALCLAVFGAQELELRVPNEALPHPGKTEQLMRLCLVARTEHGQLGQYNQFSFREPGWGRLIIAAVCEDVDEEGILFGTAARHLFMAVVLSARLQRGGFPERLARLWAYLANAPEDLLKSIHDIPLSYHGTLVLAAKAGRQPELAKQFWRAIEGDPDKLAARAWETPLHFVASFLDTAKRHERDTAPLWEAIEKEPDKLAARAWETPLGDLGSFLDTAKRHERDTAPLWEAIEKEPDKLAARAWETPLHFVASFLDTAKRHERDTAPLWEAIEKEPDKLATRAWETPLGDLGSFFDTAKRHERDTAPLWKAIEKEPDKLATRAWETPLGHLASFLDTAKRHERDTAPLWEAIEKEPDKLATRAWETPLGHLASFLDNAKRHERKTAPLWEAIEMEPDKLTARAWETPLDHLGSFFDTAKRHERDTAPLWKAIEKEPDKLATRAWETPLGHLASFLDTAKRHERDTAPLWKAIEKEPDKLATRAWETPLGHLASFLDTAKRHERDTAPLWEAIEKEPDKLAARAWETPLGDLGSFFDTAKRHERDMTALVKALESDPKRLSALAKETRVGNLAGFCHHAPATLVQVALADFQKTHWDEISISEPLAGAIWVAIRCGEVGREDLKSALTLVVLRRANMQDFPLGMSLFHIDWLLANTPPTANSLVPVFLDALCTKKWLGWQFTNSSCGALATGLRMLAMHQSPEVCKRFHNRGLGIRLHNELGRWDQLDHKERITAIQLFGCATLCGSIVRPHWLVKVPTSEFADLPVNALPHRPDAQEVEDWQFQLWLGLRAIATVTKVPLAVPPAIISQTLALWGANLEQTSCQPNSAEYRVNRSMMVWLEKCLASNPVQILPEKEPLWVPIGFP